LASAPLLRLTPRNCSPCDLSATPDGQRIYEKAGFILTKAPSMKLFFDDRRWAATIVVASQIYKCGSAAIAMAGATAP
jgi:hypothetical protein